MKKPPYNQNQLQTLTNLWYRRLKEAGFSDIESSPVYLKEWDSHYFQSNYSPLTFSAQREYYYLAEHFLIAHTFSSLLEKRIWELHSVGTPVREIALKLKNTHSPHCTSTSCDLFCPHFNSGLHSEALNKDKVAATINRLKKIMLQRKITVDTEEP